jgi:MFS transporter, putative metabolite:H+ symporter
MFNQLKAHSASIENTVTRGNFFALFTSRQRFGKYARCILIGLPTWFVIGVLVTFSPEFARALGIIGEVSVAHAVSLAYLGLTFGDFASGFGSQWVRSRKKVVFVFLLLTAAAIAAYLLSNGWSRAAFYTVITLLGFGIGYWAVFVTVGAEQFGTNLRATVATTVPNFVRGAVVPITLSFQYLKIHYGILPAAAVVGAICMLAALWALQGLEETYGKNLDYLEPQ